MAVKTPHDHNQLVLLDAPTETRVCALDGCEKVPQTRGANYCSRYCFSKSRRVERTCQNQKCGKTFFIPLSLAKQGRGLYCKRDCYLTVPMGSKHTRKDGYVQIKIGRGAKGWEREHRYIVEQQIGRKLHSHEYVHHKNGIKHDNRPENLELCTKRRQPPGQRVVDLLAFAREILDTYEPIEGQLTLV